MKSSVPARLRRGLLVPALTALLVAGAGAASALAENAPPDAIDDSATATSGELKLIDVRANDQNPDEDGLDVIALGTPAHGSVATDGVDVTYTSDAGYVGPDSFTYTVQDGGLATDTATVSVDVRACDPLAGSIDVGNIVTGEQWINCSSFEAVAAVGDMTPVMNISGDKQALMTTGTVEGANAPNNLPDSGVIHNTEHRGAFDVSILALDLQVPTGVNCLGLELAFQSEEYPENVDSAFNDGFLAELDVSDWAVSGSSILAPNNFAFDGAGNIVSVNSSFFDAERVVTGDDTGTEYDGSTPLLEARTPIEPGPHTLYLSIFDATDHEYDSAVFMDRLRAFTAAEGTCLKGAKQAPNALNDSMTTAEDAAGSMNVLANDSDPDGDPITIIEETNGAHGTVTCGGTDCTYTPEADYHGTDSFTYRITDGFASDRATVQVTVNPVPDAPQAVDDDLTTNEDEAAAVSVLSNDFDVDDDALTVTGRTNGSNGSVSCSETSCTYDPATDYSGPDSFTYTVSDGTLTDTGTVNVQVRPINDPPVAAGDSVTTDEDEAVQVAPLANDADPDGDALSITSSSQGIDGSVTCTATSCEYTPKPNFNGLDSFTYSISDGKGGTDSATVAITVSPVQDPPTAADDSATTDEDQAKTVNVLSNDIDPDRDSLSVTSKTNGTHGTVTCSASSCTYTPDANWSGTDSFTYTISDGNGGIDTANVSMTVTPVNDPPVAQDDTLTTDEDAPGEVSVLTNDVDGAEDDPLTISSETNGDHGSVICSTTTCTYTPEADYNGSDSFTYTVSDGNGGFDTASVTVTVNPVNDQPVATNDSLQTRVNRSKSVTVLANDSDVDGDPLSISAKTNGDHGTVECSGNSCTYTPDAAWSGSDSFTYTISDGNGGSATGTVAVTVAVNAAPDAVLSPSPTTSVNEGGSVSFSAAGSSDGDGEITSYDWSVSDGRTMTGTAANIVFADNGTFGVTVEVCDDDGACDTASATVTVNNVAPIAFFSVQPTVPLRINTNVSPSAQPGAAASFTASASDPGGAEDPLTFGWNFGDGSTLPEGSSAGASHAYKKLGRFTASVTVRDGDGGVVSATSQPVNVLPTGACGKFKSAYWGKPGATATVVARTQFWYVKGREKRKIKNAFINPGQIVKLQAKPGSRSQFQQVCINNKRYFRVEKVTSSLPKLNYEYLPESALLRLS